MVSPNGTESRTIQAVGVIRTACDNAGQSSSERLFSLEPYKAALFTHAAAKGTGQQLIEGIERAHRVCYWLNCGGSGNLSAFNVVNAQASVDHDVCMLHQAQHPVCFNIKSHVNTTTPLLCSVLSAAADGGMSSLAMPLIGGGVAGWPAKLAAQVQTAQLHDFVKAATGVSSLKVTMSLPNAC